MFGFYTIFLYRDYFIFQKLMSNEFNCILKKDFYSPYMKGHEEILRHIIKEVSENYLLDVGKIMEFEDFYHQLMQ